MDEISVTLTADTWLHPGHDLAVITCGVEGYDEYSHIVRSLR